MISPTNVIKMLILFLLLSQVNVCGQNTESKVENKVLSSDDYVLFKNIALEKANYFFFLMNRIGSKDTPRDSLTYFLDEADLLFHDSALMQIRTKDGKTSKRPVMQYLRRLSQLNYNTLKIDVISAYFVSELKFVRSNKKGNVLIKEFEGVIKFVQYFEGKVGDKIIYKDTSEKAMRVHVLINESDIGRTWDVLLGDVDVLEVNE